MSKVKQVFVLSQYGVWSQDYTRRKSGLVGVYTQRHQLYKAMMVLCNVEGSLNDYNSHPLPGAFFEDEREVNYRRLCGEVGKSPRRVQLFDSEREPFFNVWECPLNLIPNIFQEESESGAWWDLERFTREGDDEGDDEEDDEEENE